MKLDVRLSVLPILSATLFATAMWHVCGSVSFARIADSCNSPSRVSVELDEAVLLVRENVPRSESLVFHESNPEQLDALHRQVIAAVAFDRIPAKLPIINGKIEEVDSDWVLTGRYSPVSWKLRGGTLQYRLVAETSHLSLYSKHDPPFVLLDDENKNCKIGTWFRPVMAAFVVFVIIGFLTVFLSGNRIEISPSAMVAIAAFGMAMLVLCAFTHTLRSPNGTAVYAGKAKLWLLCGVPHGYLTDSAWTVFLPAYPPALAILSYFYYVLAGRCDNWIVQVVPFSGVFWCMFVLFVRAHGIVGKSLVVFFFSLASSVYIAAGFYPEGFVALAMILALSRMEKGDFGWLTWLIAGVAAMFKNEGLLFYLGLIVAVSVTMKMRRRWMLWAAIGALPSVVWQVAVRLCGGGIDGYEVQTLDNFFCHVWMAAEGLARILFDWRSGCVVLIVLPILSAVKRSVLDVLHRRLIVLVIVFSAVSLCGVILIYGWCEDWNILWRIDSSLFRLIWTPAVVSIWGMLVIVYSRTQTPLLAGGSS